MPKKIIAEFQDRHSGWTETYYFGDSSAYNPEKLMQDFRSHRLKVLGTGCYLTNVKVSQTANPRLITPFPQEAEGIARDDPNASGAKEFADQSHTCVLLPFVITGGGKRFVTLSGFPDSWMRRTVSVEGFMTLSNEGKNNLNTYYEWLLEAPTLQARIRQSAGNFAKTAITAIAEHESGRYKITSTLAANLAIGDKVTLTKLSGNNLVGMGGQRKVVSVLDGTSFTIDRGPRADLGDLTYLGGAFVQKVDHTFVTCLESPEPYIISTRKRGRGFSKRRGRRSAKR